MNSIPYHTLFEEASTLLQELIAIPSFSREEDKAADQVVTFFQQKNVPVNRSLNNTWVTNKHFNESKPSILLNSHIDTVKPNSGYTNDPFNATINEGKLFGLGTTDAGASLVSLAAAFLHFYEKPDLPYNIIFAASAEEEISGANGIERLFKLEAFETLFKYPGSFAIVGEPTQLQLAIAEKGLLVFDCLVTGVAGHAAREEGENAIYKALESIEWFRTHRFERKSEFLGDVKMNVTSINTENTAHNVIPAQCSFVVDIRVTDAYTHEEILDIVKKGSGAEIKARSMRLKSSYIPPDHPVVKAGVDLGKQVFGSPTLSDKSLVPLPALKCGPGNSAQSHSANEYVLLKDLEDGIEFYIKLLAKLTNNL